MLLECEFYRRHPASGQYPSSLSDLIRPTFGDESLLTNREADLIDPWGNPYRYAVVKNANGGVELYVWVERVVNGKLRLFGAKAAAGGKPELFGLPDED